MESKKQTIKNNKQAISLIVLVITIIVMVILAGAIILTLNNSGIIEKASEAVDASDEATVKELAQLAWAEAYADGVRAEAELKEAIVAALEKNNLNSEDYGLVVTTSGVTIKKGWLKDGFTVVKGEQVLEIGDVVNYDAGVSAYTGGWKVLGADDNGNLLIMSAGDVSFKALGTIDDLTATQNDWLNTVSLLDTECEPYGHGEGVVGEARSITVEDVNAVTGYDLKTDTQYGNEVSYLYNETTTPAYSSKVSNGTLTIEHSNGFYYYDGKEFKHITDLTTGTSGNVFAKITNTGYSYEISNLTTINEETNVKAVTMLFGEIDIDSYTSYYWLATTSVDVGKSGLSYGAFIISNGGISTSGLWSSSGFATDDGKPVRAVVTLSSDINFTGSSETGWSY